MHCQPPHQRETVRIVGILNMSMFDRAASRSSCYKRTSPRRRAKTGVVTISGHYSHTRRWVYFSAPQTRTGLFSGYQGLNIMNLRFFCGGSVHCVVVGQGVRHTFFYTPACLEYTKANLLSNQTKRATVWRCYHHRELHIVLP